MTSAPGKRTLVAPGAPVGVQYGSPVTLGRICIPACVAFDPRSIRITASMTIAGQPCNVPVQATTLATCLGPFSCNDVTVTFEARPRTSNPFDADFCCRKLRIVLRGCAGRLDGVRIMIQAPQNMNLGVTALGSGVFESAFACREWNGEIVAIEIRGMDGTLLCAKTIQAPTCSIRTE